MEKTFSTEYTELKQSRAARNHGGRRPRKERRRRENVDEDGREIIDERRGRRLEGRRPDDQKNEVFGPPPPPWTQRTRRQKQQVAASDTADAGAADGENSGEVVPRALAGRLLQQQQGGGGEGGCGHGLAARALECHVRKAAQALRALAPKQRPRKRAALLAFLERRGCCRVSSTLAVPPDTLVAALPACLPPDAPQQLHNELAVLSADSLEPEVSEVGGSEEVARMAATRVAMNLRRFGYCRFLELQLGAKAAWLCQQSYGALCVEPAALADDISEQCLVTLGSDGKLAYDEAALNAVPKPQTAAGWDAADLHCMTANLRNVNLRVPLGHGFSARHIAKILRMWGLAACVARWRSAALGALREAGTTVLADVGANVEWEWYEKAESWGLVVVLTTRVLAGSDSCACVDAFIAALEESAVADINAAYNLQQPAVPPMSLCGLIAQHRRDQDAELLEAVTNSGHVSFGGGCGGKRW